jgi:hypothetical protein
MPDAHLCACADGEQEGLGGVSKPHVHAVLDLAKGMQGCHPHCVMELPCNPPSSMCNVSRSRTERRSTVSVPVSANSAQASAVMTNPGGTARPTLLISRRDAPLIPSCSTCAISCYL